jgi:hypothetical protein
MQEAIKGKEEGIFEEMMEKTRGKRVTIRAPVLTLEVLTIGLLNMGNTCSKKLLAFKW